MAPCGLLLAIQGRADADSGAPRGEADLDARALKSGWGFFLGFVAILVSMNSRSDIHVGDVAREGVWSASWR